MEDEQAQRALLEEILEEAGHTVSVAGNATEGWAKIQEERFDLLIADIYVKSGDQFVADGGVMLIARIRRHSAAPEVHWAKTMPILAISGGLSIRGGFDPLLTARDMGANAGMRKPIEIETLLHAVSRLLEGQMSATDQFAILGG